MPNGNNPSYEELKSRLEAAESALAAIRNGQVDTVIGEKENLVIRLARAEARERHIKQVLLAIRNVNQLIVSENDPEALIENACTTLTETLGYLNAWIILFDETAENLHLYAASGFEKEFDLLIAQIKRGNYTDCIKKALSQDKLVVIAAPERECRDCPLSSIYGGRAGLSQSLRFGGRLYGVLCVSVPREYANDSEEQDLFNELCGDLSFALHKIESEKQIHWLTQIVNTTPQPMAFVSNDYSYLAINRAYCDLYKTGSDKIANKPISHFLDEKLYESRIKPRLDKCLSGEIVKYEHQIDLPDNPQRWMSVEYVPYRDRNGHITGIVVHGLDITKRKRAQQKLLQSEIRYRSLFEKAGDGILMMSDEHFIDCNEATVRMFGCATKDAIIGKTPWDLSPTKQADGEDTQTKGYRFLENVAKGIDQHFEWIHTRKDGTNFYVEVSLSKVDIDNEQVVHAILRDITERKKAEEKLNLNSLTLNQIEDRVVVTNLEGIITYVNDSVCHMLGNSRDNLIGASINIFGENPKTGATQKQILESSLENGNWRGEITNYTSDGSPVVLDTRTQIVYDNNDKPIAICGISTDITTRKKNENAIRESEGKLRAIIDSSPLAIVMLDRNGVILDSNEEHASKVGKTRDEILGRVVWDFLPDSVRNHRKSQVEQVFQTSDTVWSEDERNGHWNEYSIYPSTFAENGEVSTVVVEALDITKRKNFERKLKESEEQKNLILNATSEMVAYYDTDMRVIWANKASAESVGKRSEELIGMHCYEIWHNRSAPCENCPVLNAYKNKKPSVGEQTTPDGRHWYLRGYPIFDKNKEVIALVEFGLDITEQKNATESLGASEKKFRSVIEQSNDGIYILYNNRFDLVNNRFLELTGVDEEVLKAPDFDFRSLVASKDRMIIDERNAIRARGKEPPDVYEFTIKRRDGEEVNVQASVREIEYEDGRAILGILRDITMQKALEEQLLQAQKIESIGHLAGGIAHDFNNMLTPIIGNVDFMKMDMQEDDPHWDELDEIQTTAEELANLTKQLLAYGRKQLMEFKIIDLNMMIRNYMKILRRTIREDINIKTILDSEIDRISADSTQIGQVLLNLCVNSQHAMPNGGSIEIETKQVNFDKEYATKHLDIKAGKYVQLSVTDTGIGMDAETKKKIFEPYFTTKEIGKGTGMGLATVYGIVKQHDGSIEVSSEPGKGATFRLYLPATDGDQDTESTKSQLNSARGGKELVLIVEDNVGVRKLTERILQAKGYNVVEASNPREALEIIEELEHIDLLLTDVVMPEMNGKELYEKIATRQPKVKVIYMSGYPRDVIAHHGIMDDGIEFLQKPFSIELLVKRVRDVLDR